MGIRPVKVSDNVELHGDDRREFVTRDSATSLVVPEGAVEQVHVDRGRDRSDKTRK